MALRWYTVVVDSTDIASLGRWWAGTGIVFVPVAQAKTVKNRLHIDLAPHTSDDRDAEISRLLERGAGLADVGQGDDVSWTVLTDPEGNEFRVLSSRGR